MRLNRAPNLKNVGKHLLKNERIPERRNYCTENKDAKPIERKHVNQPPLSESLPGLPKAIYGSSKGLDEFSTKVTKLPNGLRVASENRFGQFCTVGAALDAGCRFEVAYPSGISHFLEKLAFQSTKKFANKIEIFKQLEESGGICDCQISRDVAIYAASARRDEVDPVIKVIADAVLRPNITHQELEEARNTVGYELESLQTKPEQDLLLQDMIHAAAFRDNTVGLPKLCPDKNKLVIDRSILFTYLKNYYTPSRMVIAGVGVDHDELVKSVKKYFVHEGPSWHEHEDLIKTDRKYEADNSLAQYTGGIVQEVCDIPNFPGPSGLPELAHIAIGLESTSYVDEDFVPVCLLNAMMGGGGSFSAGGPGKGMFTRLYTNVLNRHGWIQSAVAFNQSYADTGLFYIHASSTPDYIAGVTEVIIKELVAMAGVVDKVELSRAKKQLQSMLLMNLEAKPVHFEDIARQILAHGHRKQAEAYIRQIENITADDIIRVANRMLASPVSVAARGDISKLPSYADIQSALTSFRYSEFKAMAGPGW